MNIYLTGMPGSGKTTVGKRLARVAEFTFTDLDVVLSEQEAMPVTDIFARKGEAYFRQAESDALKTTIDSRRSIIATGGGTPCFFDNMDWMNQHGITIFLDVPIAELIRRLTASPQAQQKRPLFANKSHEELTESLYTMQQNRLPFYEKSQFRLLPHQTGPDKIIAFLNEKVPAWKN